MESTPSRSDAPDATTDDLFAPSLPSDAPAPSTWPGERAPSPPPDAPPHYEILGELGRGGMGVVYRARDRRLGRVCALKMILHAGNASPVALDRFRDEALAVARLQHPGVVQVFEVGEHGGKPFMALEYCHGGTLDAALNRSPLAPADAARLVRGLAAAVSACHAAGVVHRDLKPANVLLANDGAAKVADFGLAKIVDASGDTRTSGVLGTPSYMPPEQAEGRPVDSRADVYSLGAILYACLTGRPPFRAASPVDTLMQVVRDDPPPPSALNAAVPRDLETVALKCLSKSPADRYPTAAELADDLGRFLRGEPVAARPVTAGERLAKWVRRNRALAAAVAVAAAALVAGSAASAWFGYASSLDAEAARRAERDATEQKGRADKESAEAVRLAGEEAAARKTADERLARAERLVYAARLEQARQAFDAGRGDEAFMRLDACPPGLRGWEHAHLAARYDSLLALKTQSTASAVAWSPDGAVLALGGWSGPVTLHDGRTGKHLRSVALPRGEGGRCLAWNPDGSVLLAGAGGSVAHIDPAAGRVTKTVWLFRTEVSSVAWHPSGRRFLATADDGDAGLYDRDGGDIRDTHKLPGRVLGSAWSPDGRRYALACMDGTVAVFSAATGRRVYAARVQPRGVASVAWSPDGAVIAAGCWSGDLRLLDAPTGRETASLAGHADGVFALAWSPDGARLLSGSQDKTARVWDRSGVDAPRVLLGRLDRVHCAAWSPDGRRVAAGGNGGTVHVYDADRGQGLPRLSPANDPASAVACRPGGGLVAVGHRSGRVRVLRAADLAETASIDGHFGAADRLAWSEDGRFLASGSGDRTIRVIDGRTFRRLHTFAEPQLWISDLSWCPESRRLLSSCQDGTWRVHDGRTGEMTLSRHVTDVGLAAVAWRPGGRGFVVAAGDGTFRAYDAGGALLRTSKPHDGYVRSLKFSPDGRHLLSAGYDGTVRVAAAGSGATVLTIRDHAGAVSGAAWSADGSRIFSAGSNGSLRVHDAARGIQLQELRPTAAGLVSVTAGDDGRVYAVDATGVAVCLDVTTRSMPADDAAGRSAYHAARAAEAASRKDAFAEAWHVGRLLLDTPADAELMRRREEAAGRVPDQAPAQMPKVRR